MNKKKWIIRHIVMRKNPKVLVATQCFPPDASTTATYIGAIAQALARDTTVIVLSGSPGSATDGPADPEVIEIPTWTTEKSALLSIIIFASRMLLSIFTLAAFMTTTPNVRACNCCAISLLPMR